MHAILSTRAITTASLSVAVLVGALALPAAPAAAAAAISLSRGTAAPGDRVTVTGSGFHAGDATSAIAYLRVGGRAQQVQASTVSVVSNTGSMQTSIVLPAGTDTGTYAVVARDAHGSSATRYVTVLPLVSVRVGGRAPTVRVIGGQAFYINGSGFGSKESVRISASFPLYGGDTITTTTTRGTSSPGSFTKAALRVPRNAAARTASLVAVGTTSGRRATANLAVTYRPSIRVSPGTVQPGGSITVRGSNFVAGTRVTASLTIPRTDGSRVTVSKSPVADGNGGFTTTLAFPRDVANGAYTVTAVDSAGGFRASARVTVARRPPPTATATPTPLPTATPTATATPKPKSLGFSYISLWYHPVRAGTWDYLDIQAKPKKKLGIWVQVIFPNGKHYYYYENTNSHGRWQKRFTIPRDARSRNSNQADITIQLWMGKKSVRSFRSFTIA